QAHLHSVFQADLACHRTRVRKLVMWAATAVALFGLLVLTLRSVAAFIAGGAFIVSLVFLVRQYLETVDGPFCPGCGERQFALLASHCPQCGSPNLEPQRSILQYPRCYACGVSFRLGKRAPRFARRFCSR